LALLLQEYNQRVSGVPLFTEIRNVTDPCLIQDVLENHGYTYEDHLNYLLDLSRNEETILQSFTKSTRNRIRRVLRQGDIIVREVTERTMLPLFYEVLLKTFKTVRVPLADISLFETAFDVLRPKNMAYFTIAYINEAPAAAQVSILYKDVVFGWYNGVDRSCKYCNDILMWNLIKWGAENGYGVLDFGGAGKPGEKYGVRDFKGKFNGKLVSYGRNTRVHAPIRMKVSQKAYQVARDSLYGLRRLGTGFSISPTR
jgi:lipid II:glycine glycyltransferase (peptidoglycan interpeptide bridge formation enzyme)